MLYFSNCTHIQPLNRSIEAPKGPNSFRLPQDNHYWNVCCILAGTVVTKLCVCVIWYPTLDLQKTFPTYIFYFYLYFYDNLTMLESVDVCRKPIDAGPECLLPSAKHGGSEWAQTAVFLQPLGPLIALHGCITAKQYETIVWDQMHPMVPTLYLHDVPHILRW